MENQNIWLSSIYFVRDVILRPAEVFRKTKNGETQREVMIVFGVAAVISLFKSFSARRQFINFFADESLNRILSILSIPQLTWLITYVIYFAVIYFVFRICRLFGGAESLKSFMLVLMSISGVGVASQIFFYPIHFVLPKNITSIGSYCVYFWVVGLSIRAIQITEKLSFSKAVASFLPPAIFFAVIYGMSVVSPYLAWLVG